MNSKKIYLLISRFPDNGARTFGVMTGNYFPHASIGLEEDLNTFYSFVTKGFIVEKITKYVKSGKKPFPCQLYEMNVTEVVYNKIKELLNSFVQLKEKFHYTKLGVVLSLFHLPYKGNSSRFFCTQFVADILQRSGATNLKKRCNFYFANDLKVLPGMKLNFNGNMRSMLEHFSLLPANL